LPTGYGRESKDPCFQGGTIYNDSASGLIWVENQVSLGANKTVMGKARFKQWLWDLCVSKVKHYHGDNGLSLPRNTVVIVTRKDKVNLSQGLALNTKIHVLRESSKQPCTWHGPLWSMLPCIGQIVDLMIYLSGLLR
jgi:hypothetical protein